MTASMRKASAKDGVTVNAVSHGTIHSSALNSRFREAAVERRSQQPIVAEVIRIDEAWLVVFERNILARGCRINCVYAR
jgi:NAD(P)-dependent dehydrogenase (short-subunit alcohol dehydrogenase family)